MLVFLHSEDGLSVSVPRSLLVASSELLKELLHDMCAHVDVHVSLAGVDANTLSMFSELLRSGKVKRAIDKNLSDTSHRNLTRLLRSLFSPIWLVSQQEVHVNETDINQNFSTQAKDGQKYQQPISLKKRRKSLAGPRSKVCNQNVDLVNESNAEILQVFQETVPRESLRRFIVSGIATSTPRTSPVRPSTSAHVDKGRRSSINRRDMNVDLSPKVDKVKAEAIDNEFDRILERGLNEAGYDKKNDVEVISFACPFCKREFRRHHALKDHVNRFHPESGKKQTKIECKLCNMQFISKGGLSNHNRVKHKNNNMVRPQEFIKPTAQIRSNDPKRKSKDKSSSNSKSKNSKFNSKDSTTSKAKSKTAKIKKVCSEFNSDDQAQNTTNDMTAEHESQLQYHCDNCSEIYDEAGKEDHEIKTGHKAFTKFRAPRLPQIEF